MDRREFLSTSAADAVGFASPKEAMKAPREKLLYVTCTYANTDTDKPDYLAVIDVDPDSDSYSKVVQGLSMIKPGDELHHFGWNICSSCHGKPGDRRFLIVPGLASGRIHIVDTNQPMAPKLHKIIQPEEVAKKTDLSAPHTVHCLPSVEIMISMLGNA